MKQKITWERVALALAVLAASAFAVYLATRTWAWSLIDDPGQVLDLRERIDESGWLVGSLRRVAELADSDLSWGLFRPSWWVYPSLVYWMPDWAAHLLRFACLLAAWIGPLVAMRRRGAKAPVLAAALFIFMASVYFLMWGVFTISIQELSFAAFLGIGLMFRSRGWRLVFWTIAVWFKAPLAWILIGEAIVLWRMGRRKLAIANATIAVVTLAAAAIMSRSGVYTSDYSIGRNSLLPMWQNATNLMDPWFTLALVALAWWLIVTQSRLRWTSDSAVFAVGFSLYTLQMLPWGVSGHYMGGISYLLALLLTSLMTNPPRMSRIQLAAALAVPALIGLGTFRAAVIIGLDANTETLVLRDCLVGLGSGDVVVSSGYGPEAVVRLAQNAVLVDPAWNGTVTLAPSEGAFTGSHPPEVFIGLLDESPPPSENYIEICRHEGTGVFVRAG